MSRSERLQTRFRVIQEAVAHVHGKDMAFAAASVAWLESLEYYCLQALRRIEKYSDGPEARDEIPVLHKEIKDLLQSYHKEICEHLKLSQVQAIERSAAFKEVVNDICNERG